MNEKKALFVSFLFLSIFFTFFHSIFVVLTRNSSIVNKTRTKKTNVRKIGFAWTACSHWIRKHFHMKNMKICVTIFFSRSTLPPLICICSTTFFPKHIIAINIYTKWIMIDFVHTTDENSNHNVYPLGLITRT